MEWLERRMAWLDGMNLRMLVACFELPSLPCKLLALLASRAKRPSAAKKRGSITASLLLLRRVCTAKTAYRHVQCNARVFSHTTSWAAKTALCEVYGAAPLHLPCSSWYSSLVNGEYWRLVAIDQLLQYCASIRHAAFLGFVTQARPMTIIITSWSVLSPYSLLLPLPLCASISSSFPQRAIHTPFPSTLRSP
jgi:hypothetical protein